ncbi:hypothetical protein P152DRAFT_467929 [Eremomyces bilateralis CBS 781.70]|uniref:DUF974-domain-containing protein n=1 Tax=Eremomyces bilateralis CBS 781.70 TaxID=1392243 RepID=A0A6G1FX05_9PEZI|nr:uncharacterized protein P152DRAFT_467929 [Eremomyces bilateralis CBS 781.70]KAF1810210.1 hypothetical protein P152DRAFT_467929 [Eremomyces bilateralis CBS 781.70]
MSRQRAQSTSDAIKGPHSVSLKVLRLSRPSLAGQTALPALDEDKDLSLPRHASRGYPASDAHDLSTIAPVLRLPESFAAAYVGEFFTCTLCGNNEIDEGDETRAVSRVRITAEMQTPSNPGGAQVDLDTTNGGAEAADVAPGSSLQKIFRVELKEEGKHTLVVTVSYTETQFASEGKAAGGRMRTFRKLYQFVAMPLIGVRTKTNELPSKKDGARFCLEAQLENLSDHTVCLQSVDILPKPPFKPSSFNWELNLANPTSPTIGPRDVYQIAFLLEQQPTKDSGADVGPSLTPDKRLILGQLSIHWTSPMGDQGSLSTGWLTSILPSA